LPASELSIMQMQKWDAPLQTAGPSFVNLSRHQQPIQNWGNKNPPVWTGRSSTID
jgi:hypothetical protein